MASYSISPDGVEEVALELAGATRRLATSLECLQSAVQRFLQANSGQTLDAYATAQHAWTQGQSEMRRALLLGQQRLEEIVHAYVAADTKGAGVFGR